MVSVGLKRTRGLIFVSNSITIVLLCIPNPNNNPRVTVIIVRLRISSDDDNNACLLIFRPVILRYFCVNTKAKYYVFRDIRLEINIHGPVLRYDAHDGRNTQSLLLWIGRQPLQRVGLGITGPDAGGFIHDLRPELYDENYFHDRHTNGDCCRRQTVFVPTTGYNNRLLILDPQDRNRTRKGNRIPGRETPEFRRRPSQDE